jgi:putative transposase
MVGKAEDYAWSSAASHCGLRDDPLLSPLPGFITVSTRDWPAWLAEKEDEKILATIRLRTRTGRPAGDKKFVAALESRLGRRLQPGPIDRPKKQKQETSPSK